MATEGTVPVRRAILTHLKADAALTAAVPATSIHPQSPLNAPTFPFMRYGSPAATPILASCVDGDDILVAIHTFAKARYSGQAMVETAEDHADRIGTLGIRALHRRRLDLGGGKTAYVRRTGHQLRQDGDEKDAYHHIASYRVRVLS